MTRTSRALALLRGSRRMAVAATCAPIHTRTDISHAAYVAAYAAVQARLDGASIAQEAAAYDAAYAEALDVSRVTG